MQRIRILISGDVQGVGFRAWTLRFAQGKSLTGWVKNREDGAVEAVAEGAKKDLEELIKACHRGPEVAWVEKVDVTWSKGTGEFVGFEVVL